MKIFAPKNRTAIRSLTASTVETRLVQSPRPIDYLADFRAPGLTARDHAVLEVLIAAAYEVKTSFSKAFYRCPISAVLAILGTKGRRREVLQSLQRLSSTECHLPGFKQIKGRLSAKRAARMIETMESRGWSDERIAAEIDHLRMRARLPFGEWYAEDDGKPIVRPQSRRPDLGFEVRKLTVWDRLARVPADEPPVWYDLPECDVKRFNPIVRILIEGDTLAYELAPYLRAFLDRRRLQTSRSRVPYAYIDLRVMADFRCRFTPAIYRYLLYTMYDRTVKRVSEGKHLTVVSADDLVDITGFPLQSGSGKMAQIRSRLIAPMVKDFGAMASDLSVSCRDSDGRFQFEVDQKPKPLVRRKTYRVRGRDGKNVDLDFWHRLMLPEIPELEIPANVYLKFYQNARERQDDGDGGYVLRDIQESDLERFAWAWLYAKDEVQTGVYLTVAGPDRRLRGPHLRNEIQSRGAAEAAFEFFLEELWSPDLVSRENQARLVYEGTRTAVLADWKARLRAHKAGREPTLVPRTPRKGWEEERRTRKYLSPQEEFPFFKRQAPTVRPRGHDGIIFDNGILVTGWEYREAPSREDIDQMLDALLKEHPMSDPEKARRDRRVLLEPETGDEGGGPDKRTGDSTSNF